MATVLPSSHRRRQRLHHFLLVAFLVAVFSSILSSQLRLLARTNGHDDNSNGGVSVGDVPLLPSSSSTMPVTSLQKKTNDAILDSLNGDGAAAATTLDKTTSQTNTPGNRPKVLNLQWNEDGCQQVAVETSLVQNGTSAAFSSSSTSTHTRTLPKGLVVTVVLAPKNRQHAIQGREQICRNLPNQWAYFLHPQGIDMLLLIQDEKGKPGWGWNTQRFVECLHLGMESTQLEYKSGRNVTAATTTTTKLQDTTKKKRIWNNLDGSTIETTEYSFQGPARRAPPIKIFIATTVVQYPPYIRANPSLLELRKSGPVGCSARLRYLNGCRFYTQEMLHLQILQQYDFFVKMDTDIVFRGSPNFYMLQDMRAKGAVFAHAGEYHPWGDGSCAPGILDAIDNFTASVTSTLQQQQQQKKEEEEVESAIPPWKGSICSAKAPEIQRNADQYYGNFIIGSVEYFTSHWVLQFANFLSNYPRGFFRQKWGDQIFWHYAMGIFLGGSDQMGVVDFTRYVSDYTDLRCKPNPNCWFSSNDVDHYGINASIQCSGKDEVFAHTKSLDFALDALRRAHAMASNRHAMGNATLTGSSQKSPYLPSVPLWFADPLAQPLFRSKYPAKCGG